MTTFEVRQQEDGFWRVVKINNQESETPYKDLSEQIANDIVNHLNRSIGEEHDSNHVTREYHHPVDPMWEYLERLPEEPEDSA